MVEPQPGDWVMVWAQVAKPSDKHGGPHPEDMTLKMASHSDHYRADVRRDHIIFTPGSSPSWARRCPAVIRDSSDGGGDSVLWQCTRNEEHPGDHTANHARSGTPSLIWSDSGSYGNIDTE